MESSKRVISVFTLNTWGMPLNLSKNKNERFEALANALARSDFDVICLQEVWTRKDYRLLKRQIIDIYPHHHYYYSGVLGSGLCIFSKWPIVSTFFYRFPINGYFHMVHHGDWFGGKGVALAQLNINGFIVNVYNTHLHAQYDERDDKYLAHRIIQAFDTGTFVRLTSNSASVCIIAGDLNSEPTDLSHKLIMCTADLKDVFFEINKNLQGLGTIDCFRNTYSSKAALSTSELGKRIDYILFRAVGGVEVQTQSYSHPLEARVPGKTFSYSDHEAICTSIVVTTGKEHADGKSDGLYSLCSEEILEESIQVCTQALQILKKNQVFYLFLAIVTLVLTSILASFLRNLNSYFPPVVMLSMYLIFFFGLIMSTIWHFEEFKAIRSARKRLKVYLNYEISKKL